MKNEFNLVKKEQLTKTVWEFWFGGERLPNWQAGQYMEWILPHSNPDKRGTRRFFTLASSPTEKELMIATKIIEPASTFKVALKNLNIGDSIIARGVDGDFVLPKSQQEKLVFIAGGIGITPFRSMIKYLLDTGEKRDIVLLYSNKDSSDVAFSELFNEAKKIGVKTINYFTSGSPISNSIRVEDDSVTSAKGKNTEDIVYGFITAEEIQIKVLNWQERTFYISGPEPMVEAYEKMLNSIGVKRRQIKTDYFPGYSETYQNNN